MSSRVLCVYLNHMVREHGSYGWNGTQHRDQSFSFRKLIWNVYPAALSMLHISCMIDNGNIILILVMCEFLVPR